MKIEILREFLFLAERLNFSATAKHFYLNQSALSKHIQDLEREIDAKLFIRDKHSVRLSALGKTFFEGASKTVAAYDDALFEMEQARRTMDSTLTIGYLYGATRKFLPHACKLFAAKRPDTKLMLYSLGAGALREALNANFIHMAIGMAETDELSTLYEYHWLYEDSFAVVVPAGHRLADKESVSVAELGGETLLCGNAQYIKDSTGNQNTRLRRAGFEGSIAELVTDGESLPMLLKVHASPAIFPNHMSGYYGPALKFIPFNDIDLRCDVTAYWKKSKEKQSIFDFLDCLDEAMDTLKDYE